MTEHQYEWLNCAIWGSPVLEIGNRMVNGVENGRKLVSDGKYTGVDLIDGEGVDIVCDFSSQDVELLGFNGKFKTIFCMSVLEHVKDVFSCCNNIKKCLQKSGILFVSVPWVWRYHGYPNDYWRFSPDALEYLFSGLECIREESFLHFINSDETCDVYEYGMLEKMVSKEPDRLLEPVMINMAFKA